MSYQTRSTNPYIMEKKLNECVGGGGLDPSVLEEIEAEISVLGSENATMAQDIIDIKGSLNSINDNLAWKTHVENNAGSLSANVRTFNMPSAWKEAHIVTSYNIGNTSTTDGLTPCCIVNILNTQNKYFVRNSASNKNINIKYDNQTNILTVDMTENGSAVTPSYASIYYR